MKSSKIMMKEIQENLDKWRDGVSLQMGRFSSVEMPVIPKLKSRASRIPTNILEEFPIVGIGKLFINVTQKSKGTQKPKTALKKGKENKNQFQNSHWSCSGFVIKLQ